jgi:hypothetical protein
MRGTEGSWKQQIPFVTFLACPRKVTERRAPGENPLRHARSSSVHFGNSPFGLRHPKCFTLGLGRLPGFSHGNAAIALDLVLTKPRTSLERPYKISGHPSRPKEASPQGRHACLRPQAEFAWASGRGPRRVRYFIVAPCGAPILREDVILIARYALAPGFRTRKGCAQNASVIFMMPMLLATSLRGQEQLFIEGVLVHD